MNKHIISEEKKNEVISLFLLKEDNSIINIATITVLSKYKTSEIVDKYYKNRMLKEINVEYELVT